jgi:membrane fusion protein (multidrug efflux system)
MQKGRSAMRWFLIALGIAGSLAGCERHEAKPQVRAPVEVTVERIASRDVPVTFEYVGQTESTRQVQIRARVDGFLDQRVYTEGSLVNAGDVMFRQDAKPFQATLDEARAALAKQKARLQTANDNLARVRPLAAQKALSQKDLDDATGQQQAAAAAVDSAKAEVEQAELNLGYTTITTPVTGLSSYAQVQEGVYVSSANSLLTYVAEIDTIRVNFSVSENDMLRVRRDREAGRLRTPEKDEYVVEIVLADGTTFPQKGRITFANADYNAKTGTFLLRATFPNPDVMLRPGQFVRVRIAGAIRPHAILVPQAAVLQGAKGHFVVVVDKESKAEIRPVEVGPWLGNDWFIVRGLAEGDVVVTDGVVRLTPGAPVKIADAASPAAGSRPAAPGDAKK